MEELAKSLNASNEENITGKLEGQSKTKLLPDLKVNFRTLFFKFHSKIILTDVHLSRFYTLI
jgi:hypothetical protein